jgi:hypothetical protein
VDIYSSLGLPINGSQEFQELLMTMARQALANHLSIQGIQGGK